MAKSARASAVKKNNQRLKKKVFGPVESARNERLSAKLLELANQPKTPNSEMEIEQDEAKDATAADAEAEAEVKTTSNDQDVDMDADESSTTKPSTRSNRALKRQKAARTTRIEKKKHTRKPRNKIAFPTHPKKAKRGS